MKPRPARIPIESSAAMNCAWSALPAAPLSGGVLSTAFANRGCLHLQDAARLLQELPYGRTSSPHDYVLVLEEGRGTCSSKHALAAMLAKDVGVGVQLVLACFEMNDANMPGVGDVLSRAGLASILEAHCFLRYENQGVDLTWPSQEACPAEYLYETIIAPEQLRSCKTSYHQSKLEAWARSMKLPHSADNLWHIREQCIAALQSAV